MKTWPCLLLLPILSSVSVLTAQTLQESQHFVVLSADIKDSELDGEYKAAIGFFGNLYPGRILEVSPDQLDNTFNARDFPVLWVYKNDSLPVESAFAKRSISALKSYIKNGGKVILANQAVMLIKQIGLEETAPLTRPKASADEGYGRQLGYHAFLSHPLFEGMNGGAYVLKPEKDTVVLQTGYFGDEALNGKIVAVDWDYIFLRENSKLILEYDYGKGKVLAIGGYLLFGMPNRNSIHLHKLTRNALAYISGEISDPDKYYWRQGASESSEKAFTFKEPLPPAVAEPGDSPGIGLQIGPAPCSGNYWDLAGERMLVMGTDTGGIAEIWAHPCLALRDFRGSFKLFKKGDESDPMNDLSGSNPGITVLPASYVRNYSLDGVHLEKLTETITVSPDQPVTVINYDYTGQSQIQIGFDFTLLFRLMWPYSEKVLGDLYYSWNETLNALIASDESGNYVTIVGILVVNDGPANLTDLQMVPIEISSNENRMNGIAHQDFTIRLEAQGSIRFNVIIVSSSEGLDKTVSYYYDAKKDPSSVFTNSAKHADSLLANSLLITGPDSLFNQGFRWAVLATDRFQVNTPGIGSALVAGYATSDNGWDGEHAVSGRPGYGWYFGRDGEWSGFALLHYGDHEKVRQMLEVFMKFQDLNGKIFHELSTSGIAHYDAADATPLFILLAGRYLRHSGDLGFIRNHWPQILKAIDFCYATDTDGDKLIENTNVGHGWVEGGHLFGSQTSLYLASCWAGALEEAAGMATALGEKTLANRYIQDSREVTAILNRDFWNPAAEYYYHGLLPDGSFKADISIMPAIPILFGQADPEKAEKILPAIASNAFTTDWGCRIVPENDPHFNPKGYHSGSVWPLFTGWAALAEFRAGSYLQGYSHLTSNLEIWKYWGLGFMEEVLNGEVFHPAGVCHHQCWSETMAIQPLIEGMMGFRPDALHRKLALSPWLPADWDSVEVSNIRVGEERISLSVQRSKVKSQRLVISDSVITRYLFSKKPAGRIDVHFMPVFPPGAMTDRITVNGQPVKAYAIKQNPQGWRVADFGFLLDSTAVVEVFWHGGITVLPLAPSPKPGDRSKGFRILETDYSEDTYSVRLQAPRSSRQELEVWAAMPGSCSVEGGSVRSIEGNILTIEVEFPDRETDYAEKTILIKM
jgi:glycogen debranching enzyme